MQYKIGNSKKIHDKGETIELICPKCSEKVKFSVFTNLDVKLTSKFPLIDGHNVYFLVCPKCASVFGTSNSVGKDFKKDKNALGNFDLVPLEKFNNE